MHNMIREISDHILGYSGTRCSVWEKKILCVTRPRPGPYLATRHPSDLPDLPCCWHWPLRNCHMSDILLRTNICCCAPYNLRGDLSMDVTLRSGTWPPFQFLLKADTAGLKNGLVQALGQLGPGGVSVTASISAFPPVLEHWTSSPYSVRTVFTLVARSSNLHYTVQHTQYPILCPYWVL